ncbi:MAG: hypothetical protein ACM33B_05930 [Pseudomonadota bacterium]
MSRRLLLILVVLVAAAAVAAVSVRAGGRDTARPDCTWGGSSVSATVVDGRVVASTPETSGCLPGGR